MPVDLHMLNRDPDDDEPGITCTLTFDDCGVKRIKVRLPQYSTEEYITFINDSYYVSTGGDELYKCERNG